MKFYWLLLGVLAVWRVTHLLSAEDGPWDLVVRLRARAGDSQLGRALDCFYCLSLWTALPVAIMIAHGVEESVLLWLALSAGAIVIEKASSAKGAVAPALYWKEGEQPDVLRKEETSPSDSGDQQLR